MLPLLIFFFLAVYVQSESKAGIGTKDFTSERPQQLGMDKNASMERKTQEVLFKICHKPSGEN